MRLALLCVAFVACGDPELAGKWTLLTSRFDGSTCTGSMSLTGPNTGAIGSFTFDSCSTSSAGAGEPLGPGSVSIAAGGGKASGRLAPEQYQLLLIYGATYTATTIDGHIGKTTEPAGLYGTFSARR